MIPLLELVEVTRRFPGVVALDRVDFDLRAGEVHALVGENGAGKSTLINLISGVLPPDEGRIFLRGEPAGLIDPVTARRKGIATVHQEADLFGTLSVAENMALSRGLPTDALGLVRWRQVERDARDAVATLREPIDVRGPAYRLGVAHGHMAHVAAAVAQRARIVILDEPTGALTEVETAWLFAQIERLKADGVGLIYITHRHEEIFRLADRITVMRDGRRVWTGPTAAIDRAGLVRAMVGREGTPIAATRSPSDARRNESVPLLRVRGLDDAGGRFRGVNLDVHAGEILGVYGLIGAGRSEWAQALFGLRASANGSVELDGARCTIRSPGEALRAGLAYVPEDRLRQGIFPGLSVRANMVLSQLRKLGWGPFTRKKAEVAATLRMVEALGVRLRDVEQAIGQLSGGNQQKVVFGRWLMTSPRVLLLDEPTRGVDVGAKLEIHRLVRRLADDGCGVVLISSELPEILENSDRIAVFREGEVAGVFEADAATPFALTEAALPREARDPDDRPGARSRSRRRRAGMPLNEVGLVVALAGLAACLATTTGGRFVAPENLLGVISNASVLTILALGASAVIIAGGIDISVGSLLALAAAVGGLVMKRFPSPALGVPLGLLAGMAVGALGGGINAGVAILGRVHPIVVTLGTLTIFRGLLLSLTGGSVVNELPEGFGRLATGRVWGVRGSVVVMILTAVAVHVWLAHTRSGRHLFAFGSNRVAARLVGIKQGRVWLTAFGVGGLCAGLAGLLELAQNGSMQSGLGTGYELRAIAAAVVGGTAVTGGRGSVLGVVLGALLLGLLQNALVLWGVSRYRYDVVLGGLLLAAILVDLGVRRFER